MISTNVSQNVKDELQTVYLTLDSVSMMAQLKVMQRHLMSFAWNINGINDPVSQGAIEEKTVLTALKAAAQEQMAYFRFEKPKDKKTGREHGAREKTRLSRSGMK